MRSLPIDWCISTFLFSELQLVFLIFLEKLSIGTSHFMYDGKDLVRMVIERPSWSPFYLPSFLVWQSLIINNFHCSLSFSDFDHIIMCLRKAHNTANRQAEIENMRMSNSLVGDKENYWKREYSTIFQIIWIGIYCFARKDKLSKQAELLIQKIYIKNINSR